MSDILAEILSHTREELIRRKIRRPGSEVRAAMKDAPPPMDFMAAIVEKSPPRRSLPAGDPTRLRQGYGGQVAVIAEVKKASPSKGVLCADFDPVAIAKAYEAAGAAAISVLTNEKYFGGKVEDLSAIRGAVRLPLLRKDFIVDSYQLFEARAAGADAVLLISEALVPDALKGLLDLTRELGMRALVESHDLAHLERAIESGARLIGVNNRDLRSLRVDLAVTERLSHDVPPDRVLVSESGIATAEHVRRLAACGVRAVLVGEALMTAGDVAAKLRSLSLAM